MGATKRLIVVIIKPGDTSGPCSWFLAIVLCDRTCQRSARAAGLLTEPSGSRWICARCPSYLYSARKVAPLSFSCASASGMPSQILASIGFNGTPGGISKRK